MSLESALDEERLEVIRILEGKTHAPKGPPSRRRSSPPVRQSPVRSMLDISSTKTASKQLQNRSHQRKESSPSSPPIRSMLDTSTPPPVPSSGISPSRMDRVNAAGVRTRLNPENAYQFEMTPSIDTQSLPKRVTQGGHRQKKSAQPPGTTSVAAVGQRSAGGVREPRMSQSPSSRVPGARSASHGSRRLNTNSLNLMSNPTTFTTDSGKQINLQTAYRRLSDAALLRSGGSLSTLGVRKASDPAKGESSAPDGSIRMHKDGIGETGEEAIDSTDNDVDSDESFMDESSSKKNLRGRRRTRRPKSLGDGGNGSSAEEYEDKAPKSLLAAAEDERKRLSTTHKVRSLLEPEVTITGPDGEKPHIQTHKRPGVHPTTSFDLGSARSTPINSDNEAEISDIKNAQKLSMTVTPIHSSPGAHRVIRQIVRGQFSTFQKEADQGLRRQRVYLVATDLSEEAAYAIEWTIGTVLRDGDSMIAVYAVDEESGTGSTGDTNVAPSDGTTRSVGKIEAASVSQDIASFMSPTNSSNKDSQSISHKHVRGLSTASTHLETSPSTNSLKEVSETFKGMPDFANMGKAERERYQACTEVSERCIKLLRKTRLQVRVVVEVFHCKSPKHMITEVIDYLEPTLVILGSRGRSALKGVLLGSFSNYLVTKSSVPVMVARKRLRKHSKFKRANLRLSNVLLTPQRSLASAKID